MLFAYFLVLGKSCKGCPFLSNRHNRYDRIVDGAGEALLQTGEEESTAGGRLRFAA